MSESMFETKEVKETKGYSEGYSQENMDIDNMMSLDEKEAEYVEGLDRSDDLHVLVFSSKDLPNPEEKKAYQREWDSRERFVISKQAVEASGFFKAILEDNFEEEIPCPGVSQDVLRYVVEYLNKHEEIGYKTKPDPNDEKKTIPDNILKPLKHDKFEDNVKNHWDVNFINSITGSADNKNIHPDRKVMLFNVVMAANYLDIPPLLQLMAGKVASMIKNKSVTSVGDILDV